MKTFEDALTVVLGQEKGYVNDPVDPGGATNFGITQAVARAHGYQGDMQDFTQDAASAIYRSDYWNACKCDSLAWPLSLYVFDCAVNQGPGTAIRVLQHSLGTVEDGIIGSMTLQLAAKYTPWTAARFMALRAIRYMASPEFSHDGEGWLTRLFSVTVQA